MLERPNSFNAKITSLHYVPEAENLYSLIDIRFVEQREQAKWAKENENESTNSSSQKKSKSLAEMRPKGLFDSIKPKVEIEVEKKSESSDCGSISIESVEVFQIGDLKDTVITKVVQSQNYMGPAKFGAEYLKDENGNSVLTKMNNIKQEFLEYENKAKENHIKQQTDDVASNQEFLENKKQQPKQNYNNSVSHNQKLLEQLLGPC